MNAHLKGRRSGLVLIVTACLVSTAASVAGAETTGPDIAAPAPAASDTAPPAPVPTATAAPATTPPELADGFGLTVVSEPEWVGDAGRTFRFSVAAEQVPTPTLLPQQEPGTHVIMVTLPEDYEATSTTRHPVLYSLHGGVDRPDTLTNLRIAEQSTSDTDLIVVHPNGSGRGWYTNWLNPGALGPQDWEDFHLDGVIPFIDANLRTIPTREGRSVIGHSMGGFGAFRYAQRRPDLFSHVGSMSGGLDLRGAEQRAVVVGSLVTEVGGVPTAGGDAIFGAPFWPYDAMWNAESPAHDVAALRGMGVAMYVGDGGDLLDDPVQALIEHRARQTNLLAASQLTAAGIPFDFVDYGNGSDWAPGCTGKHAQEPCLQADLDHFVQLISR
ncbi:S-formylglutathione hydrolase FrmB [Actinoalloteichus hoggarensis]|uniref:Endo-1,4-beta-xylanase Z n=1 Tax=Actinoalloteichus hoggarensis TaxID=1470176 RepID=A0A221W5G0_9PSEU|nr:alpha/beta hydrolase-fold protein [Actinoalloteichus hoggarensis]ASO21130.1 Endo-1,4-beta-xylanase Z precursor [Actinoalloteichus hoggarensis]MBB5921059.1 S-formylglutathione hydrolase FrmB [Actinoalloteichus hoggarensis]